MKSIIKISLNRFLNTINELHSQDKDHYKHLHRFLGFNLNQGVNQGVTWVISGGNIAQNGSKILIFAIRPLDSSSIDA